MKPRNMILIMLLGSIIMLVGCTATNPQYTALPIDQRTNQTAIPQYIPDPRINGLSNTLGSIVATTAPVNPYAGLAMGAIALIFGIWGTVATKIATKQSGAIDTLAAGAVKAGPQVVSAILSHVSNASNGVHFATIANAINDNTGANQNSAGTTLPPTPTS